MNQVWSTRESADSRLVRAYVKRLREKAGRDRRQSQVHLQRTQGGLPHGAGRGNRNGTARYCLSGHDPHTLSGSRTRLLTPSQPWSPAPWLYRQICRPPSEGRGDKRQNAYRSPRSERLLWRSGGSRAFGLLGPGRAAPFNAGSRGTVRHLLAACSGAGGHLRSGGAKLKAAV